MTAAPTSASNPPRRRVRLLLFRLGGRGYATPRRRVRAVIDVGTGHPPVPGLRDTSLRALHPGARPAALVSLRQAVGLPEREAPGRILVVTVASRAVGFLVDEVVGVVDARADQIEQPPTRLGGYVSGRVHLDDDPDTWSLIEWESVTPPTRGS